MCVIFHKETVNVVLLTAFTSRKMTLANACAAGSWPPVLLPPWELLSVGVVSGCVRDYSVWLASGE